MESTCADTKNTLSLQALVLAFHRSAGNSSSDSNKLNGIQMKSVLASFMKFRQQNRLAILFYIMFLILFISSFWVSQQLYMLILCALCFLAYMATSKITYVQKQSLFELLGKKAQPDSFLRNLSRISPHYFWIQFRSEYYMRTLLSAFILDSGLIHTTRPA